MKKRLAVLLILLLCLPALAQAYTGSYGGSTLFTFSYDSGRFRMDQDSYLGGNRSNQVWFFMLYDSDYTIDCGMFVNESTQSMSNGDTSALSLYLAGYYARYGASSQGTCTINGQGYALFSLSGVSTGGSYLAATVINGCVVTFEIYSPSAGAVDAGALSTLKTVLAGCYPAKSGLFIVAGKLIARLFPSRGAWLRPRRTRRPDGSYCGAVWRQFLPWRPAPGCAARRRIRAARRCPG